VSNQCAAESPDGFAGARERFETILRWLDGGPSTLLDHGELERQLDIEGRRLLRQLLQDQLDLRGMREIRVKVRDAGGHRRSRVETGHTRGLAPALALDLAAVVTVLRDIQVPHSALADPQLRWYRGAPLGSMDDTTRRYVAACWDISGLDVDLDAALRVWEEAMALPETGPGSEPRWYHGDLMAENLLVRGGRLAAVLDFGGLAVGDPTVDLIVASEVLDPAARDVFRSAVVVDETSWLRGRAWALSLALGTFLYYWSTMPDRCASRLAMEQANLRVSQ
jgi:aminoglycoside phosphotransferase (APT) family kinase protein